MGGRIRHRAASDALTFDHVTFSYGDAPVLTDICMTIPKGKTVAVVGPSGAGKSTMADLIPRFYDVAGGAIRIDGRDIRTLRMEELVSLMGIVTQESILFNDTVFNNIAGGTISGPSTAASGRSSAR